MRPFRWYIHTRIAGLVVFAIGMLIVGLGVARGVASPPSTQSLTRTLHRTMTQTRLVTVRVRGRVIRRHDHILVVLVPRTIFHTRTTPSRRIVVPRHVVRIHESPPVFGEQSAVSVIGVAPPPQTVTVTQTIAVPGPTVTVTSVQTVTETTPPTTLTVTVTLPSLPEGTQ